MENECRELGISFHLLLGQPVAVLPQFIESHNMGGLVTDFSPLRMARQWVKEVKKAIPDTIPMCRVIHSMFRLVIQ